jgi:hypothetical protein
MSKEFDVYFEAKLEDAKSVIMDYENYPKFLHSLEEVKLIKQKDNVAEVKIFFNL